MMKEVPLSRGYVALVDDADYPRVAKFGWYACEVKRKDGTLYTVYAQRKLKKFRCNQNVKKVRLHRFILGITDPCILVDHRDGNGLNCQRNNLRTATYRQNAQNSRKRRGKYTSRYKGVWLHRLTGKWTSVIRTNSGRKYLGLFETEEAAAEAYTKATLLYHGEFARG